ncbi:hypothetical protein H2248_012100 [Termitomyces sp. 'cryptogamus']|nr:hypothetical protein H2248_012100 [Termitomyces sp. 'cryptogamus']
MPLLVRMANRRLLSDPYIDNEPATVSNMIVPFDATQSGNVFMRKLSFLVTVTPKYASESVGSRVQTIQNSFDSVIVICSIQNQMSSNRKHSPRIFSPMNILGDFSLPHSMVLPDTRTRGAINQPYHIARVDVSSAAVAG